MHTVGQSVAWPPTSRSFTKYKTSHTSSTLTQEHRLQASATLDLRLWDSHLSGKNKNITLLRPSLHSALGMQSFCEGAWPVTLETRSSS